MNRIERFVACILHEQYEMYYALSQGKITLQEYDKLLISQYYEYKGEIK